MKKSKFTVFNRMKTLKLYEIMVLVLILCMAFTACNNTGASGTVETDVAEKVVEMGETISSDSFEIKVNSVEISKKVSLDGATLYKARPESSTSGLVAGDSSVYVILEMDIKNVSKEKLATSDAFRKMRVDYDDGYLYEYNHSAWLGAALPFDGDIYVEPLVSVPYRVIFECAEDIKETSKSLTLDFVDNVSGVETTQKVNLR